MQNTAPPVSIFICYTASKSIFWLMGIWPLPNGILHELDIVVASPHINLRQTPEVATQRLLKAIAHPAVDIIGHPRGRILGGRLGAPVDMERVIVAAAHHGARR
jgi:DNA polymerase (family 10)